MAISLEQVAKIATQMGFSDEQVKAIVAVKSSEGDGIGDHGTSFGPLQFHIGGQLNNFASAIGTSDLGAAGQYAIDHPDEAVAWALNNYLGNAVRRLSGSYSGPDLAFFLSKEGQGSRSITEWTRAADIWRSLWGSGTSVQSIIQGIGNIAVQVPGAIGSAIGSAIGNAGGTQITNFIQLLSTIDQFLKNPHAILDNPIASTVFVFVLGIVLMFLGLLTTVVSESVKVVSKVI